jgi:GT2 family glycosyltransferase
MARPTLVQPAQVRPRTSVVVPTFNRRHDLIRTLHSLRAIDYAPDCWEVVVVDDGSTDDTGAAVQAWIEDGNPTVRYFRQENSGPAVARNRGARKARGTVLIFIDDDILVQPDFVRSHVETLAAHPRCWVIGRIVHPAELRATPFGRYRDAVWESYQRSEPREGPTPTDGMTAANLSLPAADFFALDGFDERFAIASCEDWDLGLRARQAGIQVLYNPAIVVVHNDWAVSLQRFCERQRLYSISDVLLWRKHGGSSPRAALVAENSPPRWRTDRPRLLVKKAVKRALATGPGRGLIRLVCWAAERLIPDSAWCRRAYDAAVAVAIFRGVREGLRRYPEAP